MHIPVLILDNLIALPYQEIKLDISNSISKNVIKAAKNKRVLVIAPKNAKELSPSISDLPRIGVVCYIKSKIELSNSNLRVILIGEERVSVDKYFLNDVTKVLKCDVNEVNIPRLNKNKEKAMIRKLISFMEEYIHLNKSASNSIIKNLKSSKDLNYITDIIVSFIPFSYEVKLKFMQELNAFKRAEKLLVELQSEIDILHIDEELDEKIKDNFEENQKEFILKEKLKEINKELGNTRSFEIDSYIEKLNSLSLEEKTYNKLLSEIKRYEGMSESSSEGSVLKNYLDTLLNLPWNNSSDENLNISSIGKSLDKTHFGLIEVKERIKEYACMKKINSSLKSPIICLVGLPGVGKTSIAISIADALNRKFYKMSVGGLNDSLELIGSRRTYMGALPGKIMQAIIKTGVNNPLILIDEVDKMVKDYKGDPASVLLEILDNTQNKYFTDNYIEEPFSLENVFFILTANSKDEIPYILRDRLEIIDVSSYSLSEKVGICQNYFLKQIDKDFKLSKKLLEYIILNYTNEAGVRELQRCLEKLYRRCILHKKYEITESLIDEFLCDKLIDNYPSCESIGMTNTLAYTTLGGRLSRLEVVESPNDEVTGNLSEGIKESISVVKTYLQNNFKLKGSYHIHFLDTGIKKDGSSASVSLAVALLSLQKKKIISSNIAFSGELDLNGNILAVGGIKEKINAAYAKGISTIYLPLLNKNEIDKIDILGINVKLVSKFSEIYKELF